MRERHTLSEVAVKIAVRSALAQMDARTAAREYGEDAVKMTRHHELQRLAPEYARIAARLAGLALAA